MDQQLYLAQPPLTKGLPVSPVRDLVLMDDDDYQVIDALTWF